MTKWNKNWYIYNIHGTSKFGVGIILCVWETWKLIQQPLLQYSVVLSMVKTIELLYIYIFLNPSIKLILIESSQIELVFANLISISYSFCSVADRAFRQLGQHRQVHSASSAAEPGSSRALWTEAPEEGRLHGAGRSLQFCPKAFRDPGMAYWDPRPDEQPWKWALFITDPQQ